MTLLDKLPAGARYAIVLIVLSPVALFAGMVATAVVAGGTSTDWAWTGSTALDAAAKSGAGGVLVWIALYVTPITRKFGVGSVPPITPAKRSRV